MKLKIGLFGLGRTGTVVAHSLQEDERFDLAFAVRGTTDKNKEFDFLVEPKERISELIDEFNPDMVFDFTTPDAVMQNVEKLKEGTGYVIATTGFSEGQLQKLKQYNHLKILHAQNISDGINVVIKLCEVLNQIWNEADVEIIEQHFKSKKDSPSGTAQEIGRVFGSKTPIHSVRAGDIVGIHEVILATDSQKITIKHESFNKDVFAEGAKRAALWLQDKQYGFYKVSEVYK